MNIILGSNSPRRRELLKGLGVNFEVRVISGIDESYPDGLPSMKVAEYIAHTKARAYLEALKADDLVITADTIVVCDDEIMGKPSDAPDAKRMLNRLSGKTHHVITGVCVATSHRQEVFAVNTEVTFKHLSDIEIDYYITNYKPYDKAGAYGIQEWIGYIGVTSIKGSYFNVMGLPVQRIYEALKSFNVL